MIQCFEYFFRHISPHLTPTPPHSIDSVCTLLARASTYRASFNTNNTNRSPLRYYHLLETYHRCLPGSAAQQWVEEARSLIVRHHDKFLEAAEHMMGNLALLLVERRSSVDFIYRYISREPC